jgi:hypothetical protein
MRVEVSRKTPADRVLLIVQLELLGFPQACLCNDLDSRLWQLE